MPAEFGSTVALYVGRIANVIRLIASIEESSVPELLCRVMREYVRNHHAQFILRDRPDGSFSLVQANVVHTLYQRSNNLPEAPPQKLNDPQPDLDEMTVQDIEEHNAGLIAERERMMSELKEEPMRPAPKKQYRRGPRDKWGRPRKLGPPTNPSQDGYGGIPRSWGGK